MPFLMKPLILLISLSSAFVLSACTTAHYAAEDTEHVARKAGHATGHAVEKTGHAIAHGGEELEEHTN